MFSPLSSAQIVAKFLHGTDLLRARSVCARWRACMSGQVRAVIISPRHWAAQPRPKSTALAHAFRGLKTVQVGGNSRVITHLRPVWLGEPAWVSHRARVL